MPHFPRFLVRSIATTFCFATCFTGCSFIGSRSRTRTPDNAFIIYWPPARHTTRLRLAVKDIIDVKGVVSTAGSEYISTHNVPAPRDAKCLKGARQQNVLLVGKTNLSELAIAPSGLNRFFWTPKNPLNRKANLIPGGSSSGSAVAVADGLADVAFGTDTAGSIRVPAACCGVVGLKTTFGLIPLKGVFPIEPQHLDTIGPLAKDISHTVEGMDLLQPGFASLYHTASAENPSPRRIRIGRLYLKGTAPMIDRAVDDCLRKAGFEVVTLDGGFTSAWDQADRDGTTVAAGGAWLNDHFWADKPGVTARTKAVLALGAITYESAAYQSALQRQHQWQLALRHVLRRVDFIALPTLNALPPKVPPFLGSPFFESHILSLP